MWRVSSDTCFDRSSLGSITRIEELNNCIGLSVQIVRCQIRIQWFWLTLRFFMGFMLRLQLAMAGSLEEPNRAQDHRYSAHTCGDDVGCEINSASSKLSQGMENLDGLSQLVWVSWQGRSKFNPWNFKHFQAKSWNHLNSQDFKTVTFTELHQPALIVESLWTHGFLSTSFNIFHIFSWRFSNGICLQGRSVLQQDCEGLLRNFNSAHRVYLWHHVLRTRERKVRILEPLKGQWS